MKLDKTNSKLGAEVREFLEEKGVETPMKDYGFSLEDKYEGIKSKFADIMEYLGLDLKDDSLQGTPDRVAKMFVHEIFYGLDYDQFPKCTSVENKAKYDEMVVEKNITAISNCEHHFVVIDGLCHIAYVPKEKVIGLSKMNRIVQFFCARPQIQERLTEQIYWTMVYLLGTEDVAVMMDATHYCVKSRGIRDTNSSTVTSKMGGWFRKNSDSRKEFLSVVKG